MSEAWQAEVKTAASDIIKDYPGEVPAGAKAFVEFALSLRRMVPGELVPAGESKDYFRYLGMTASVASGGDPNEFVRLTNDEYLISKIMEADNVMFVRGVDNGYSG